MRKIGCTLMELILVGCALVLAAQTTQPANGPAVNMIVTAEARHGGNPPVVEADNVLVFEGKTRNRVTSWVQATGEHGALELFLLLDDSSSPDLGAQLNDIRRFIDTQPPTTKVGVAYMQNGTAQIVQNLTEDHTKAASSLRLPMGVMGINASAYFSLSDLIKRWPASSARREVVMVSDGLDRYYGFGNSEDPYVSAAIQDAQRAGIVVYAIYHPGAGHYGHSYWRAYWGQIFLSQVADETGGDSCYIGFTGAPVAFAPFLENVNRHLGNQYLLTFIAQPEKNARMQRIKINSERTDIDLVAADRVYVPAG